MANTRQMIHLKFRVKWWHKHNWRTKPIYLISWVVYLFVTPNTQDCVQQNQIRNKRALAWFGVIENDIAYLEY